MKYLQKVVVLMLICALLVPGPIALGQADEEDVQLVTARVTADLVRPGRVLMSARGNHWVYDSVPPINGPNEEVNPLDGMLAALIACGMYIYEAVGIEQEIEVSNLAATVTGELDGRGVAGFDVNPRVRAFHVTMNVDGPTAEEATMMAEAFSLRCPIYTTLALSAPIDVINMVDGEEQEPFATAADPIVDNDEAEGTELKLGMPSASGRMVEFGRSLMSARGNHWIYDSVPPINGPNEEVNPLDALVGALPACGLMIYEAVSREQDIPLHFAKATVEADLDPRGVAGTDVNPRIRAFRVNMHVSGPTAEEAEMMADEFSTRCPIYTTFERSAPIEVSHTHVTEDGHVIREVNFQFGTHPQLGFPEQHVLVQQDDLDETMGMRLTPEDAESADNLAREIFIAGADVGHDPFAVGEEPLGPFPLGDSLDMTLGDWLAATGSGTYRVVGNHGEVSLSLQNMVPNGTYTLWCTRITVPPEFLMVNKACGPLDGSANTFTADEDGNVEFAMETWALDDTSAETVSVFAVAYHSDGQTYAESPGTFGLNSHVQVFTILPPFADEAWQVLPANAESVGMMDAATAGFDVGNGAILEVDFTYDFDTAEEYITAVAPLAETYAAVEGLRWKAWTINEEAKRAGAVYLFASAAARTAYLESDLAVLVASYPALSDFRVQEYTIMATESMITSAPVGMEITNDVAGIGTMLQINFTYNVPVADYVAEVSPLAEQFAAAEGVRWKIWALDEEKSQFSGILFFDTPADVQAFAESALAATVMSHPALSDFVVTTYGILGEQSLVTRAPVGVMGE